MTFNRFIVFMLIFCPFFSAADDTVELSFAEKLHYQACSIKPYVSDDPWHIANLYDCVNKELYIPYQLWSGAEWGGDKYSACMHEVNRKSVLSQPAEDYASGEVIVNGPIEWTDPHTGELLQVWERIRPNINSHKYYACHSRGIGVVHNPLKLNSRYVRGLCRAPAGFGWKVGVKRTCIKTTVEIVEVVIDQNNHLENIVVDYWFRDKLKYRYIYKPRQGETNILLYRK